MRPYETMLRRYRETARGLLGYFPAASTVIPRHRAHLSLFLSFSLTLTHRGYEAVYTAMAWLPPRRSFSYEKQCLVTRRKLLETSALVDDVFFSQPLSLPCPLRNRPAKVPRSREHENYFPPMEKYAGKVYEMFLTRCGELRKMLSFSSRYDRNTNRRLSGARDKSILVSIIPDIA